MSIDETSLSNGEVYTFLSNKDAHCKKGAIAAYVKGTKSDDIVKNIGLWVKMGVFLSEKHPFVFL